jgi:hypothetical protein
MGESPPRPFLEGAVRPPPKTEDLPPLNIRIRNTNLYILGFIVTLLLLWEPLGGSNKVAVFGINLLTVHKGAFGVQRKYWKL